MLDPQCNRGPGGSEDLEMGICLETHAIPLDAHDVLKRKQFFPIGPENYMQQKSPNYPTWWYEVNEWENVTYGGIDGIADTFANVHYVSPKNMYTMNYFAYDVYPFGLQREKEVLPKRFSLEEIFKQSDTESSSPNYHKHTPIHNLEDDEKF